MRSVLAICIPAVFMSFGQGMVIPTIPAIAAHFAVSPGLAAQLVTAQSLGRALFLLPAGVLVDRVGGRRCTIVGPPAAALAGVIAPLAPEFFGDPRSPNSLPGLERRMLGKSTECTTRQSV